MSSSSIEQLSVDLRQSAEDSRRLIRTCIQKACADTKADAQAMAPVRNGDLRSSISYSTKVNKNSIVGEVGPTVDYGLYVELGTSRMSPQPYMRPAFERQSEVLQQVLEQLKIGEIT